MTPISPPCPSGAAGARCLAQWESLSSTFFQAFHSFHAHGLGNPQCGIVLVSAWARQSVQTLCRSAARHHVGATGRQDPAILCLNVWVHGPATRAPRCLPKPPTAEDSTLGLFEGKLTTR